MDKLNEAIDFKARFSFSQEFLDNNDAKDIRAEALGMLVAEWAEWDIDMVVRICATALEDANAHDLAGILEDAA